MVASLPAAFIMESAIARTNPFEAVAKRDAAFMIASLGVRVYAANRPMVAVRDAPFMIESLIVLVSAALV